MANRNASLEIASFVRAGNTAHPLLVASAIGVQKELRLRPEGSIHPSLRRPSGPPIPFVRRPVAHATGIGFVGPPRL